MGVWPPGIGVADVRKKSLYAKSITPDYPLFRACWVVASASNERQEDIEALPQFLNVLNPLRYMTFGLFALLLIWLPIVLLGFGTGLGLLLLLGVIYCTITVMLAQLQTT